MFYLLLLMCVFAKDANSDFLKFSQSESAKISDEDIYKSVEDLLSGDNTTSVQDVYFYESLSYLIRTVLRYVLVIILALNIGKLVTIILNHLTKRTEPTARDITSITGLVLIIFGIVAVVLLVESVQIISTAVGVLGTIAGYIFGTIRERFGIDKSEVDKVPSQPTDKGDTPPQTGQDDDGQPATASSQT